MQALPVADRWFELREVADGVHLIEEPHVDPYLASNVWLVRGRDRDLVIDTANGIAPLRPVVEGHGGRPVVAVATHAHFDHVGGMHEFDARWIHPADAAEMAEPSDPLRLLGADLSPAFIRDMAYYGYAPPEVLLRALPEAGFDVAGFRTRPAGATRELEDGDVVELGDRRLEVLHVPGHTPGSIALWEPSARVLFTGDTVYADDALHAIDRAAFERSLLRLRELPAALVCAGHNRPFGHGELVAIVERELGG
ncbi:MAG: MBL fold metallo-hydrolase [Candidatus Velamenicoccus archaeovorus]